MNKIPISQVKFHPQSYGNYNIRVFTWERSIYRGISAELAPFFEELFRNGVIKKLNDKELFIESAIAPLVMDGYEIIVRHRYLPFPSYPYEWCLAMLKDAALTLINLAIELTEYGLTLADGHPWNILFDAYKPVFVDLGAIDTIHASTWSVYNQFCNFCLYPLLLSYYGRPELAKFLMCEVQGVTKEDLLILTQGKALARTQQKQSFINIVESAIRQVIPDDTRQIIKQNINNLLWRYQGKSPNIISNLDPVTEIRYRNHCNILKNIINQIEGIVLPPWKREEKQEMSLNYSEVQENWTSKEKNIHKIITELKPDSVLDIGAGQGWYAKLAARLGCQVVAFDNDENCVTQLYYEAREEKLQILPLMMDFTKPTPSRGLGDFVGSAASKRFQCDLVLALGLVRHIVLEGDITFDHIVEGLALFAKRWVVVEFTPHTDRDLAERWSFRLFWYNLENFIDRLKKQFVSVSLMPSHPDSSVLLLCEK